MPDQKPTDLSQTDEKPKDSPLESKGGPTTSASSENPTHGAELSGERSASPQESTEDALSPREAESERASTKEAEPPASKKSGAVSGGFFNETLYNALKEEKRGLIVEIESLQKEKRSFQERLREEESEKRDLNDRYLRLHADFDNFRRRWQRDKEDQRKFGHEPLTKELLGVLDNFDLALKSLEGAPTSVAEGIHMVYRQCIDALGNHGLKRFEPLGEAYDYTKHEAISLFETEDAPSDTIHQVFRAGYFLHDRLLRPALVTVARRSTKPSKSSALTSPPAEASSQGQPLEAASTSNEPPSKTPESSTETSN